MSDDGPYPPEHKMIHQIDALPNHLALYRWIATQLDIAEDLESKDGKYTLESQEFVLQFIKWAVTIFNESEEIDDPVTAEDAFNAIREMWRREAQELDRMRLIPR